MTDERIRKRTSPSVRLKERKIPANLDTGTTWKRTAFLLNDTSLSDKSGSIDVKLAMLAASPMHHTSGLDHYLKPYLSPDKQGLDVCHSSRDRIAELYRGLVRPIALGLQGCLPPSFPLDDLIQEGELGLLDAAARFESYARQKIRGAILDSAKGKRYRLATMAALPENLDPAATEPSIERQLIDRQASAMVVAEITPRQAQVLQAQVSGQSAQQSRETLRLSQRGVNDAQQRGLASMKRTRHVPSPDALATALAKKAGAA